MPEDALTVPPVFQTLDYVLRKKRGFVSSFVEVQTPDGVTVGVWVKPKRLVRAFLAVVLAPAAFLGTLSLGVWLAGAFEQGPERHSAGNDPGFWGILLGVSYAGLVIASPFIVMNWIYPLNCLVLKDLRSAKARRLEVRSRMALTLKTVRYTILGPMREKLAVVHRDIFHNRYRVFPADRGPSLWAAADEPTDEAASMSAWMLASGLFMILAAVTVGAVAVPVPGLGGSKGAYSLWIQDAPKTGRARRIGRAGSSQRPEAEVRVRVDDEAALDGQDRRLVLGLAAVLWMS